MTASRINTVTSTIWLMLALFQTVEGNAGSATVYASLGVFYFLLALL